MKNFNKVFTVIVLLFLYIPMIVLAVGSFNSGMDIAVFKSFTFDNYKELFRDSVLLPLLLNSVIVALLSSIFATILGTCAALGIHSMGPRLRRFTMGVTNIPLTNPEIVTGVSLALLFAFVGTMMKINNILGFATLLIAHITFNLPYVILFCNAEAQADGSEPARGGARPRLHAVAGVLQGRYPRDNAGHRFRRSHGLHHEP